MGSCNSQLCATEINPCSNNDLLYTDDNDDIYHKLKVLENKNKIKSLDISMAEMEPTI